MALAAPRSDRATRPERSIHLATQSRPPSAPTYPQGLRQIFQPATIDFASVLAGAL